MRNFHVHIYELFGKDHVILLQEWKDLVKKMADFNNHAKFSLRCLKVGVTLVSLRLKHNIRITKSVKS